MLSADIKVIDCDIKKKKKINFLCYYACKSLNMDVTKWMPENDILDII